MEVGPPIKAPEGILFTLKDVIYTPETPKMNQPFTVKGKVDLFKIPFMAPCWVEVTVTYPEKWWEEIIPIWGSPEKREMTMAVGGDFEVSFPRGFDREGDFSLVVRLYAGPTFSTDAITIPPVPAVATFETTFAVIGEITPPEKRFILERPTVKPATTVDPGTEITLSCPVRSESTEEERIRVRCAIFEGSFLPGRGDKITDYVSEATSIAPGETKTFDFKHTTITGTIDRRDVNVALFLNGEIVKSEEWDDLYYVGKPPEEAIDFELSKPSVTPAEVTPGTEITITCPITSGCDVEQTITAKCIIYEGSILPTHGTKITTKTSPEFTLKPGETKNMVVSHTAVAGTIDRRDIEVEVYIAGKLVKQDEWDDIYYVKKLEEIELELLEVKIDPTGAGYVTTDPEAEKGTEHNWYFPHGTIVNVTAHPNPGYVFKSWSGEMKDTPEITALVYPMTEKRTITAHFKAEVVPEEWAGTISRKVLEYNETEETIPVYNVSQGKKGLVHIWGANNTSTAKRMGINWVVTDPDGITVENYSKWEAWPYTGAGGEHEFIGGRFSLSKIGNYSISIALSMNPDSPVVVDRYTGLLCTVSEVPEAEFSLSQPYVPQAPVYPGTAIDIHCPVTMVSGEAQTRLYAIVKIYEGSFWPGHGILLLTKQTPFFSLAPGETKEVIIHRTAIAGTIDRRDVEVEIYLAGELLKGSEWDDTYYVEEKPVVKHMLMVTVYGMYPGYVTVTPGGKVTTTGSFHYDAGTRVTLTAVGGSFLRWIIDTEWQAYGVRTVTITMNRDMEAIAGFE